MIITVSPTPYGAYIFRASEKWTKRIIKHMRAFHQDAESHATAYAQGDFDLPDFVKQKHRGELADGYEVKIRVDPWEALHMWGWDAHTLAE